MQRSRTKATPQYLAGITTGAIVLTVFGAIWGLQGPQVMIVITPVVSVALLIFGIITRRAVHRQLQESGLSEEQPQGQQTARRFVLVVVIESLLIFVAVILLGHFKHPEYIAAVICLIVGLHFLPLASLFGVRLYALVGIALTLLGCIALLALLLGLTFGSLWAWSIIVGLSSAAILWLSSLAILIQVRQALASTGNIQL